MRPMQQRTYARRGEQYLLIKAPPASGKSRALMFIALDKLHNQGLKQAIIIVPERSIGGSFADEKLSATAFGPTGPSSRNGTCATRREWMSRGWPNPRSRRWASFSPATTRCWCARMRPFALPSMSSVQRGLRRTVDCCRRVPPRQQQSG